MTLLVWLIFTGRGVDPSDTDSWCSRVITIIYWKVAQNASNDFDNSKENFRTFLQNIKKEFLLDVTFLLFVDFTIFSNITK